MIYCWPALFLALVPTQSPGKDDLAFWKDPERAKAAAAAELVLATNGWTALAMREVGRRYSVWGNELVLARDQVPVLDEEWLNLVEDKKAVPDFRGRAPDEIKDHEFAFQKAYNEALAYAFLVSPEAFALKSKEHPHVTFAHFYNEPAKHRGKVIRIEGRLARVRETEAPLAAQRLGAYKLVYEGWVFGPTKGAPPFWIIFPVKPDDVPVAERMAENVTFDGYFISLIRYRAAGKDHYAPLLIGPTVVPEAPAKDAGTPSPIPIPLVAGVAGLVALVMIGLIVLSFFLSRGDRRVRRRLEDLQVARSMEALEGGIETTPGDIPQRNDETKGNFQSP